MKHWIRKHLPNTFLVIALLFIASCSEQTEAELREITQAAKEEISNEASNAAEKLQAEAQISAKQIQSDAEKAREDLVVSAQDIALTLNQVGEVAGAHFDVYTEDLEAVILDLVSVQSFIIVGANLSTSPGFTAAVLVLGMLPVWDPEERRLITYFTFAKRELEKMPNTDEYEISSLAFMLNMDPVRLWKLPILRVGEKEWISPSQARAELEMSMVVCLVHINNALDALVLEDYETCGREMLLGLEPLYEANLRFVRDPTIALAKDIKNEIVSGDILGPAKNLKAMSQALMGEFEEKRGNPEPAQGG